MLKINLEKISNKEEEWVVRLVRLRERGVPVNYPFLTHIHSIHTIIPTQPGLLVDEMG